MTRDEMLQQAYAYGSSVALQEVGIDKLSADQTAIKIAASGPEIVAALKSLLGKAGGGLSAAGQAAKSTVQGVGKNINRGLTGTAKGYRLSPQELRGLLGAGAAGGAGLGVGGTLGTQALLEGLED